MSALPSASPRPAPRAGSIAPTLFSRLEAIAALPDAALANAAGPLSREMLVAGETALEAWLRAHGRAPTDRLVEGFRVLALHRQGAKGDPSFNACRETCRELVYRVNCARAAWDEAGRARALRLAAMVASHLLLFVDGKLENAGLGDFCCSSKPLRATAPAETETL